MPVPHSMVRRIVRRYGRTKLLLLMLDLLSFGLATAVVLWARYESGLFGFNRPLPPQRAVVIALVVLLIIPTFRVQGLYKDWLYTRGAPQIVALMKSVGSVFLLIAALAFFLRPGIVPPDLRIDLVTFFGISLLFLTVARLGAFPVVAKHLGRNAWLRRRVVIVGAGDAGREVLRKLRENERLGVEVVGFVAEDEESRGQVIDGCPVIGTVDETPLLVAGSRLDEVLVAVGAMDHAHLVGVIGWCRLANVQVSVLSNHFSVIRDKGWESENDELGVVTLVSRLAPGFSPVVKRWVDVVGTLITGLVLLPALVGISLAIKITSRGPILFKTTAIGKAGRPFTFYKFRSMYVNQGDAAHRRLAERFIKNGEKGAKLSNDPRVTPIGRWLRKYSLDELAQLINVLKGDMSLVGPRPCSSYEYEMFEGWHRQRCRVLPGMTGVWQVSGRTEVPFNDMVVMDLYYVENASFWLDLTILFKTLPAVLTARGAY
jgi:exopolysaccharide biosynthesis polyprenyl glycosylphosphotransferase